MDGLTRTETNRLEELETAIERGLPTFLVVGAALLEIRDDRLYRERCATFEDYCRLRWGISRQRAYQLMDAATVCEDGQDLSTNVDKPTTEAQARVLKRLPAEMRPAAMQKAAESANGEAPTASEIEDAATLLEALPEDERKELQSQRGPGRPKERIDWSDREARILRGLRSAARILSLLTPLGKDARRCVAAWKRAIKATQELLETHKEAA